MHPEKLSAYYSGPKICLNLGLPLNYITFGRINLSKCYFPHLDGAKPIIFLIEIHLEY